MAARETLLHQDDGLVATRLRGESLADLELLVLARFLTSKGPVLDIGCGHGRACRYLRLAGFDAIGVDLDLHTLREAKVEKSQKNGDESVLTDGRKLSFRDQSFDYVISLASTLSEKHRLWMNREDRISIIREAFRVTKPDGLILVSFVHRYWSLKNFLTFLKNYWMWIAEKAAGKMTELGDYVEIIGRTPIRFHAFTIREARALFPRTNVRLDVWKRERTIHRLVLHHCKDDERDCEE